MKLLLLIFIILSLLLHIRICNCTYGTNQCVFVMALYKLDRSNAVPILNTGYGLPIIPYNYPLQNLFWERVEPFTLQSISSWEVVPIIFDNDDIKDLINGVTLNQGDQIMISIALNCTSNVNNIELDCDGTFNYLI